MIAGTRVSVRLDHSVWYERDLQEREVPAGTAMDWLNVLVLFGTVTMDPDEDYELSGSFAFTWAGRTALALQQGMRVEVAALWHDNTHFLVPLTELAYATGFTSWDQAVTIAAWQLAKVAGLYEVTKPIVLDNADGSQDFELDPGGGTPKPDAIA